MSTSARADPVGGRRLHLGWARSAEGWADPADAVDLARALERACFDVFLLEDPAPVAGGVAAGDPWALAPILTAATEHLGVSVTASTGSHPPFLLARAMATLDHLSRGRAGWTVVDAPEERGPLQAPADADAPGDDLDERTAEHLDVVERLWRSWDADALVMDRERNVYVDHTRVHRIDVRGVHHSSRGPLNTLPPPQGRPVISSADTSPAGLDLAARHADLVVGPPGSTAGMRALREDVRARAAARGRDPDDVKVLFVVSPVIGATPEHARSLARERGTAEGAAPVGTADEVAERMERIADEVGGDGFVLRPHAPTPAALHEITDGLVPALRRRGLVRTSYTTAHLRDHLLEF